MRDVRGVKRIILHFPTQEYFGCADMTGTHLINRRVATFPQDRRHTERPLDIYEIASTQTASAVGEHPTLNSRPGVQGGRPLLKEVGFLSGPSYRTTEEDGLLRKILREFPQLRPAAVHDALSYYYDHRAEIGREIAELMDLDAAMQKYPPTPPSPYCHLCTSGVSVHLWIRVPYMGHSVP